VGERRNAESQRPTTASANDIDTRQQRAAERWAERHKTALTPGQDAQPNNAKIPDQTQKIDRDLELRCEEPEDELEL
jgi:hypothetical protein